MPPQSEAAEAERHVAPPHLEREELGNPTLSVPTPPPVPAASTPEERRARPCPVPSTPLPDLSRDATDPALPYVGGSRRDKVCRGLPSSTTVLPYAGGAPSPAVPFPPLPDMGRDAPDNAPHPTSGRHRQQQHWSSTLARSPVASLHPQPHPHRHHAGIMLPAVGSRDPSSPPFVPHARADSAILAKRLRLKATVSYRVWFEGKQGRKLPDELIWMQVLFA